jgi:hypothetical protein
MVLNKRRTKNRYLKNDISLEDMVLDVDIENIQFPDEEGRVQENTQLAAELAIHNEVLSDETFSLHNALFDKSSKKLIFENFKE